MVRVGLIGFGMAGQAFSLARNPRRRGNGIGVHPGAQGNAGAGKISCNPRGADFG